MASETHSLRTTLTELDTGGAGGERAASKTVAQWQAISEALSPILGVRGVAALYQRSIHLSRAKHPWLSPLYEGALQPSKFDALDTLLAQQAPAEAAAAAAGLLLVFSTLVTHLIGESLSKRLLGSILE